MHDQIACQYSVHFYRFESLVHILIFTLQLQNESFTSFEGSWTQQKHFISTYNCVIRALSALMIFHQIRSRSNDLLLR